MTEPLGVPKLEYMSDQRLTTGHTDEAVVVLLGVNVNIICFTPAQARDLAANLLELANDVDGGRGVS